MGGFGRKSRNKQAAPAPLSTKPKRKANPNLPNDIKRTKLLSPLASDNGVEEAEPARKKPKVLRSGGKSVARKERERREREEEEMERRIKKEAKKTQSKGKAKGKAEQGSDEEEQAGLEEARGAMFSAVDLEAPSEDDDIDVAVASVDSEINVPLGTASSSGSDSDELDDGIDLKGIKQDKGVDDDHVGGQDAIDIALANSAEGVESRLGSHEDAAQADDDENGLDDLLAASARNEHSAPDFRLISTRMTESVRILADWSRLSGKVGDRSRSEVEQQTLEDVREYFGYNEYLAGKLWELFGPEEALAFFEANESPRPVTIRTNSLLTTRRQLAQSLISRGVNLSPLGPWSKVGLQIFESPVPIGATPEYLAGHYMLQAASSFLPVMALDPKPGEKALDMSAAPGGKTTYMAAMMANSGVVFANDSNKARCKSLSANVSRMGCRNVVVCNYDAREFPKVMGGFDRVLLDAPCSGTGVISKDASVKVNKSEKDFMMLSHLQKQLLLCAIDSCSPNSANGGYVVYSTCSITIDENEAVVDYALRKRPHVTLVPTGAGEFGREGFTRFRGYSFDWRLRMCRRYYPHVHNVDGFFVAKFKVGKKPKSAANGGTESADADVGMINLEGADADSGITFDTKADDALIAEAKRSQLKAKGVKPPKKANTGDSADAEAVVMELKKTTSVGKYVGKPGRTNE